MVLLGWGGELLCNSPTLKEAGLRVKTSPCWAGLGAPSQLCLFSEGSEVGRSAPHAPSTFTILSFLPGYLASSFVSLKVWGGGGR